MPKSSRSPTKCAARDPAPRIVYVLRAIDTTKDEPLYKFVAVAEREILEREAQRLGINIPCDLASKGKATLMTDAGMEYVFHAYEMPAARKIAHFVSWGVEGGKVGLKEFATEASMNTFLKPYCGVREQFEVRNWAHHKESKTHFEMYSISLDE